MKMRSKSALSALSLLVLVVGLVTLPGMSGCKPETDLPADAYGTDKDPLPEGAESVSQDEFERLKARGSFKLITSHTGEEETLSAEDAKQKDDETTNAFLSTHASDGTQDIELLRAQLQAKPTAQDGVVELADGSFQVALLDKMGNTQNTVRLGQTAKRAAIARAMRIFPTQVNQARVYSQIYEGLNADQLSLLRGQLGVELPDPSVFANSSDSARDAVFKGIASKWARIGDLLGYLGEAAPVRSCRSDIGVGNGGDRASAAAAATVEACATPSDTGIVKNVPYKGKKYASCVKDQANRATCWAFAALSMLESSVARKYGLYYNFSEQHLNFMVKALWWPSTFGETAGQDIVPRMITEGYRPAVENVWNYNRSSNKTANNTTQTYSHSCDNYTEFCSDTNHQGRIVCTTAAGFTFCMATAPAHPNNTYYPTYSGEFWNPASRDTSIALGALAAILGTPVEIAFDTARSFDNAVGDGFIRFDSTKSETTRGGHVTHAVGYVSNEVLHQILPSAPPAEGGGYFIIKNSWGACAGDAGYYYMPWGYVKKYAYSIQTMSGIE